MFIELSNRPLVHLVLKAITGHLPSRAAEPSPYSPPRRERHAGLAGRDQQRAVVLSEALLRELLTPGGRSDRLGLLRPDVAFWAPSCSVGSADEVRAALVTDTAGPLTDVSVITGASAVAPPHVFVEWRLKGRFREPCFLADDVLLQPTGEVVESAGVLVVTFEGGRISEARLYYDHLALVEQLVLPR